jgi:hypothetical protein
MAKKKQEAPDGGARQDQPQTTDSRRMTWLVWGVLAALVILMVSAFSKAWATNQVLKAEIAALEPVATAIMEEQLALEADLIYVKSDEYVEAWSQTQAGMVRSSETLVRPLAARRAPVPTPQVIEVPVPAPSPEPFWPSLWRSLLGE